MQWRGKTPPNQHLHRCKGLRQEGWGQQWTGSKAEEEHAVLSSMRPSALTVLTLEPNDDRIGCTLQGAWGTLGQVRWSGQGASLHGNTHRPPPTRQGEHVCNPSAVSQTHPLPPLARIRGSSLGACAGITQRHSVTGQALAHAQ